VRLRQHSALVSLRLRPILVHNSTLSLVELFRDSLFATDIQLVRGLTTGLEAHLASDQYRGIWDSSLTQGLLTIIFSRDKKPNDIRQAFITATWANFWSPDPDGQPIPELQEFIRLLLLVLKSQETSTDISFWHCSMHDPMVIAVREFLSGSFAYSLGNLTPQKKHALHRITRGWCWYANRKLDVQRSRLVDTYFLCLLHTWLTAQVESFWPSALEVLEEVIAVVGEQNTSDNFRSVGILVIVFSVREQANELRSTSFLDYERMKDAIIALLRIALRNHLDDRLTPYRCRYIMLYLTLLSCLPPDQPHGLRGILEAVWEWYETGLGPSSSSHVEVENILKGTISPTEAFNPIGMIFPKPLVFVSEASHVVVNHSGNLFTSYKDIMSIIDPDHPNVTEPYDYRAERKTNRILQDYHQTYVLPARGRDPVATVIVQSNEQLGPQSAAMSIGQCIQAGNHAR
jgi:hypothetical protein